jgi:hypothetical protein
MSLFRRDKARHAARVCERGLVLAAVAEVSAGRRVAETGGQACHIRTMPQTATARKKIAVRTKVPPSARHFRALLEQLEALLQEGGTEWSDDVVENARRRIARIDRALRRTRALAVYGVLPARTRR